MMDRTDSSLGLVSVYGEIEEDEERRENTESGVDNISDEEGTDMTPFTKNPRTVETTPITFSTNFSKPNVRNAGMVGLVSYGADDAEDEDTDSSREAAEEAEVQDGDAEDSEVAKYDVSLLAAAATESEDGIVIPPEPSGRCSRELQAKIAQHLDRVKNGWDLNASIMTKKDFRNPSIYDKLISYCDINEKGTNYPPELYNPSVWAPESYYDELAKVQRIEMERREKEKKERTKVEFVAGVKKVDTAGADLKRKTKWDTQPQGVKPTVVMTTAIKPSVISDSVKTSTTGAKTRPTVISAVGTISKEIELIPKEIVIEILLDYLNL